MSAPRVAYVVSHTHWDREWYLTLHQFRVKLVRVVREMLDETQGLVASARQGDLDKRANADGFQGGYAELVRGINETLDATTAPVNEAAEVLEKIGREPAQCLMIGDDPVMDMPAREAGIATWFVPTEGKSLKREGSDYSGSLADLAAWLEEGVRR